MRPNIQLTKQYLSKIHTEPTKILNIAIFIKAYD